MNDVLTTKTIQTPVGDMQLIASAKGLCALEFVKPDRQAMLRKRLSRWFSYDQIRNGDSEFIGAAEAWVNSYFDGKPLTLPKVKLDLRGTPFEVRVWTELRKIPLGKTISYSELAARVRIPNAPRAAGSASRRNPMSIIVPCHRVIGKSGDLTGYGGGLEQKRLLIELESAVVLCDLES